MADVQYAIATRPIKGESACGDLGWVKRFDDKLFMAMVDVAGHGPKAEALAIQCKEFFEQHYQTVNLPEIIQALHTAMQGSRGLVVGLCLLDITIGVLYYAGMGNITVKIIGKQSHEFVPRDGVVGYQITRPIWESFLLNNEDVVIMHSDGISSGVSKKKYPAIITDDVNTIVNTIINKFSKEHDDVGCVVSRYFV